MNKTVYVKNFEVTGCVVYDESTPVRMSCANCAASKTCIYKEIVFEKDE